MLLEFGLDRFLFVAVTTRCAGRDSVLSNSPSGFTIRSMARCDPMNPDKLPKYVILIRWDTFRLDLVGRAQIIGAIALAVALIGLKIFVF